MSEETPKRPYYSPSQINMFTRCPQQYEFRYMQGLKNPPVGLMVQGSAGHKAAEHNFVRKMATGEDEPLDVVSDVFSDEFDERVKLEQPIFEEGQKSSVLKDQGIEMVQAHHTVIAPSIQPAEIEQKYVVNAGEYDILGYLDLVEQNGVIVDLKYKARTPPQDDLDSDIQFTAYAMMRMVATGVPKQDMRMDIVLRQKTIRTAQLHTTRIPKQADWLFKITDAMHQSVQAGIFVPKKMVRILRHLSREISKMTTRGAKMSRVLFLALLVLGGRCG